MWLVSAGDPLPLRLPTEAGLLIADVVGAGVLAMGDLAV